jgi:threonine dehydratase
MAGIIPSRSDIEAARQRIGAHVRTTPVLRPGVGFESDADLIFKLELLQHTGSFKPRGAFSKMLVADVPEQGVIAASGGNFGLAVAYAARVLGHRAQIFVPSTSPAAKIDRVRAQGADVRVVQGYYDDASAAARTHADDTGACWMHPYDQLEVVAGQGTIAIEIADQVPAVDTVLVAVGGGGLIAGIASWFRGDVRVVGVEPWNSSCMHAALDGRPVDTEVGGVAADSLGPRRVGEIAFKVAQRYVDGVVLVSDDAIRQAQTAIWQQIQLIAEPGGAAVLAALTSGAYRPEPRERVVLLLCGANTDPSSVTA